jgi:prepilin-type N-terminal cleavage/methylation domain-containing protein
MKIQKPKSGFTLIEVIVTMAMTAMIVVSAGMLIHSGYRSWNRSFRNANCEMRLGGIDATTALGAIGRQSNRVEYYVYNVSGSTFTQALPVTDPEEVVLGDAVELRYWNGSLQTGYMDPSKTATSYALFYLDDGQLKVDYGDYPPGAINAAGHRNTPNSTATLASNVTYLRFSHTTRNLAGDGKGCVRMKLIIRDPDTGDFRTYITASMLRNVWPQ